MDFLPDNMDTKSKKPGSQLHRVNCKKKNTPIKTLLNEITLNPKITKTELAAKTGISKSSISSMLIRYGITDETLETFKESRADIFAGIQETVAASLTEGDIKKASVRDRTILLGTLYDKERLERGQSTQNVATILASSVIAATTARTDPDGLV